MPSSEGNFLEAFRVPYTFTYCSAAGLSCPTAILLGSKRFLCEPGRTRFRKRGHLRHGVRHRRVIKEQGHSSPKAWCCHEKLQKIPYVRNALPMPANRRERKAKILPTWKDCPHCGGKGLRPMTYFNEKGVYTRLCTKKACMKRTQPHDFHPHLLPRPPATAKPTYNSRPQSCSVPLRVFQQSKRTSFWMFPQDRGAHLHESRTLPLPGRRT